jgi:hypothetical protein
MIPDELCLKYLGATQSDYGDDLENFYQCFLHETDHIPNKLIESLVITLHESSALNIAVNFISWLKNVYSEYADIISYREYARQELAKIQEDNK